NNFACASTANGAAYCAQHADHVKIHRIKAGFVGQEVFRRNGDHDPSSSQTGNRRERQACKHKDVAQVNEQISGPAEPRHEYRNGHGIKEAETGAMRTLRSTVMSRMPNMEMTMPGQM